MLLSLHKSYLYKSIVSHADAEKLKEKREVKKKEKAGYGSMKRVRRRSSRQKSVAEEEAEDIAGDLIVYYLCSVVLASHFGETYS